MKEKVKKEYKKAELKKYSGLINITLAFDAGPPEIDPGILSQAS